jgi:hypothetical protein
MSLEVIICQATTCGTEIVIPFLLLQERNILPHQLGAILTFTWYVLGAVMRFGTSLCYPLVASQENHADPVPVRTADSIGRRVSHGDNSQIAPVKVKLALQVFTNKNGPIPGRR